MGEIKMSIDSNMFEQMKPGDFKKYEECLTELRARLIVDDVVKDKRGPRSVLIARSLAAKDAERLAESLTAYRELLEDPPSGEAAASD
jgi:hypothetical protein